MLPPAVSEEAARAASAQDDAAAAPSDAAAAWRQARAAADALCARQHHPAGALYAVATPIGNVADLTLRALHVLGLVDAIACEDTRVTQGLLTRLGVAPRPLVALHRHNEREAAAAVVGRLRAGERVAVVTDAGTPAVSDPGARLVASVHAAGLRVVPLPGASAPTALLAAAGAVAHDDEAAAAHLFHGFAPTKAAARATWLASVAREPRTQLWFEAPHRVDGAARALAQALADAGTPDRRITVGRELTKQFESIVTQPASTLGAWFDAHADHRRGEFVWLLHPADAPSAPPDALDPAVDALLAALVDAQPLKAAVALVADATGAPRNALYARALALRRAAAAPNEEGGAAR